MPDAVPRQYLPGSPSSIVGRLTPSNASMRRTMSIKPAGHRDGDTVCGELLDQPEPYFGSTFSRAK